MNAPLPSTPPSVVARIANLPNLGKAELDALWRETFGAEPPSNSRAFLERRLAYRLQEDAFRTVDPGLLERNQRRIEVLVATGRSARRDRDYRPIAGTVLTREYQGVVHRVVVTADGQYDFQGRPYQSLSMIAREITGTRWSGPLFFGLKAPAKGPVKTRGGRS